MLWPHKSLWGIALQFIRLRVFVFIFIIKLDDPEACLVTWQRTDLNWMAPGAITLAAKAREPASCNYMNRVSLHHLTTWTVSLHHVTTGTVSLHHLTTGTVSLHHVTTGTVSLHHVTTWTVSLHHVTTWTVSLHHLTTWTVSLHHVTTWTVSLHHLTTWTEVSRIKCWTWFILYPHNTTAV